MTDEQNAKRKVALDRALSQIEKSFGQGSIMHMDESQGASVDGISSGALSLM